MVEKVQTGDIVAYAGTCSVSDNIRMVQLLSTGINTDISHVGMAIVGSDNDVRIFEADGVVRNIPFKKTVEDGSRVRLFRRIVPLTDTEKHLLVEESKKLEGLKYDKIATYKIALNLILRLFGFGLKNKANNKFFCSELMKREYRVIGIRFKTDKDGYCLPVNIIYDKNLREIKQFSIGDVCYA